MFVLENDDSREIVSISRLSVLLLPGGWMVGDLYSHQGGLNRTLLYVV